MDTPLESKGARFSLQSYRRLLALYPRQHREDYGWPMEQLFRDQCRSALREERSWGLLKLWMRVLPDLVKTSLLEHLETLKGRKSMTEKIAPIIRPPTAPWGVFAGVFIAVFFE